MTALCGDGGRQFGGKCALSLSLSLSFWWPTRWIPMHTLSGTVSQSADCVQTVRMLVDSSDGSSSRRPNENQSSSSQWNAGTAGHILPVLGTGLL